MRQAFAGGPDVQQLGTYQLQPQQDLAHQVVDYIGTNYGYGTVLLILAVGSVVVLRKQVFKLLKGESKDGK